MGGNEGDVVKGQRFGLDAQHGRLRVRGSAALYPAGSGPDAPSLPAPGRLRRPPPRRLQSVSISVATVIGPTPPGTGVIQLARLAAASKPTSPTRRPSSRRLMPTSITTAPGFTHSPGTIPGRPTATTRMSAWRTRPRALARGEPMAAGHRAAGDHQFQRHRPADMVGDAHDGRACATHRAVGAGQQGHDAARRARAQAELAQGQVADVLGVEAVDVLARVDAVDQLGRIAASGSGNCTRMPWTSGSALSRSISASSSARWCRPAGRGRTRGCRLSRRPGACCARRRPKPGRCRPAPRPGRGAPCRRRPARDPGLEGIEQVVGDALAVKDAGGGRRACGSDRPCDGVGRTLSPTRCSLATTRRPGKP